MIRKQKVAAFFTLLLIFSSTPAALADSNPVAVESGSVIVVHASRHYTTNPDTIAATQNILTQAFKSHRPIIALAQNGTDSDPLWYARGEFTLSKWFFSHGGESSLFPKPNHASFQATLLGGYHCACLGWAISELLARALDSNRIKSVQIDLPMHAIFTGYRFDSKTKLRPATPEDEANADDSVDGLNLWQATAWMDDLRWADFMRESLKWAVFSKSPTIHANSTDVEIQVNRNGRTLLTFGSNTNWFRKRQVRLNYQ